MPRRLIYLDQRLHDAVKAYEIAVSQVCQKALRETVEARGWKPTGPPALAGQTTITEQEQR